MTRASFIVCFLCAIVQAQSLYVDSGTACLYEHDHLECWGKPLDEVPGWRTQFNRAFAKPISITKVDRIAMSPTSDHICIIRQHVLTCWGSEEKDNPKVAVPADLGSVDEVAVTLGDTCVSGKSGLRCWGRDYPRDAASLPRLTERPLALTGGARHVCALMKDKLVCWGDLGQWEHALDASQVEKLQSGWDFTCALLRNHTVDCDHFPWVMSKENVWDFATDGDFLCLFYLNGTRKCRGNVNPPGVLDDNLKAIENYLDRFPRDQSSEISMGWRMNVCVKRGDGIQCNFSEVPPAHRPVEDFPSVDESFFSRLSALVYGPEALILRDFSAYAKGSDRSHQAMLLFPTQAYLHASQMPFLRERVVPRVDALGVRLGLPTLSSMERTETRVALALRMLRSLFRYLRSELTLQTQRECQAIERSLSEPGAVSSAGKIASEIERQPRLMPELRANPRTRAAAAAIGSLIDWLR